MGQRGPPLSIRGAVPTVVAASPVPTEAKGTSQYPGPSLPSRQPFWQVRRHHPWDLLGPGATACPWRAVSLQASVPEEQTHPTPCLSCAVCRSKARCRVRSEGRVGSSWGTSVMTGRLWVWSPQRAHGSPMGPKSQKHAPEHRPLSWPDAGPCTVRKAGDPEGSAELLGRLCHVLRIRHCPT